MYIKYRNDQETSLLHLPENAVWELRCGWLEDDLCLYVQIGEQVIELSSMDDLEMMQMSMQGIEALYKATLDNIMQTLKEEPTTTWIDIGETETTLIVKNRKEWRNAGYFLD